MYYAYLFFLSILIFTNPVRAQEKESHSSQKVRLSVTWTAVPGGPSYDVAQALRAAGFDYVEEIAEFYPRIYPQTTADTHFPKTFNFRYLLRAPFGIGFSFYHKNFGETEGRQSVTGYPLVIDYGVTCLNSLFYVRYEVLEFGIGVSRNILRANEYEMPDKVKYGLVLDASLTIPRDRLFFFELKWHYNKIGNSTIGPFVRNVGLEEFVFPESMVNYSHAAISLGLGIRL